MSRKFRPEQHEFLRSYIPDHWNKEVAEEFMRRYPGEKMTAQQVQSYKRNHHLNSGKNGCPSRFSPEVCQFIKENIKGCGSAEMIEKITEKFGPVMTKKQLWVYKRNHHLTSNVDRKFTKGQKPWNKSRPWSEWMPESSAERSRKTQFQKGRIPENYKPVGSYSHTTDGYLIHKIADPDVWEFVHRKVWEDHNGPIPKGCVITFKNGDRDNCSIDNLMLLSPAEHAVMNRYGLHYKDPDLAETGRLIADVKIKANERMEEAKKKHGGRNQ